MVDKKPKGKEFVDPFDKDIDMSPLVNGAKAVVGFVFPSHDKSVRREEKKLRNLKRRVELLRLQREQDKVLKELEEVE